MQCDSELLQLREVLEKYARSVEGYTDIEHMRSLLEFVAKEGPPDLLIRLGAELYKDTIERRRNIISESN